MQSSMDNFAQKWAPSDEADNRQVSESENAGQLLLAEATSLRRNNSEQGQGVSNSRSGSSACAAAVRELNNPSSDIFTVKSGEYKGMKVPDSLRCAIFQSNLAVEAGIIRKSEVTVRALELEQTLKGKGYRAERFEPGKSYPNGTYIVGEGARDGTNSRHIALVCGGMIIHTKEGRIVQEPISAKFFSGAYDRMTVLRRR